MVHGPVAEATYIAGMDFIAWDIETDTSGGFGLDPNNGGIISIAAAGFQWGQSSTIVKTEELFVSADPNAAGEEAAMLDAFVGWLVDHPVPGPLVGWNSTVFDAPFVARRMALLGCPNLPFLILDRAIVPKYNPLPGFDGGYHHGWGTSEGSVDLAYDFFSAGWCEARSVKWNLKPVAQRHGLEPIEVDREAVHELSGDELRAYNMSDVDVTAALLAFGVRGPALSRTA